MDSSVTQRIKLVIQWLILQGYAINQEDLGRKMGIANKSYLSQLISGKANNEEFINKLSGFDSRINYDWLLTGEGDMLKTTENNLPEKYPINSEVGVPFYDINVTASITESFNDIKEKPSYKINVPFLNDCTAAFPVYGDSMLPAYRPGDTVIVKEITNRDSLLWGEVYLVITNANCDNMRTIKRVYISEDRQNYILRATNPEFAGDTIVPCDDVIGLFLVKGKISRTQL